MTPSKLMRTEQDDKFVPEEVCLVTPFHLYPTPVAPFLRPLSAGSPWTQARA